MKKILIGLLIGGGFAGCLKGDGNTSSCSYNECAVVAPATEIDSVKAFLAVRGISATQHCSGLFYTVDDPGTGATPTVCNTIAFTYEGRLTNGKIFDSSITRALAGPLNGLITGFKNGIPKIKAGGRIHMYIPPTLGYGGTATGNVPANSILIFNVNLLAVQ